MSRNTDYLKGRVNILGEDFYKVAKEQGITEEQLIEDLVASGWSQGLTVDFKDEYWEPRKCA